MAATASPRSARSSPRPFGRGTGWSSSRTPGICSTSRRRSGRPHTGRSEQRRQVASLRIASAIGPQTEGLDLRKIILDSRTQPDPETESRVLAAAIEARSLWAAPKLWRLKGVELWDGFTCGWIPLEAARAPVPLEKAEIDMRIAQLERTIAELKAQLARQR